MKWFRRKATNQHGEPAVQQQEPRTPQRKMFTTSDHAQSMSDRNEQHRREFESQLWPGKHVRISGWDLKPSYPDLIDAEITAVDMNARLAQVNTYRSGNTTSTGMWVSFDALRQR